MLAASVAMPIYLSSYGDVPDRIFSLALCVSVFFGIGSAVACAIFAAAEFGPERRTYRALRYAANEYSKGNFSVKTPVRGNGDAAALAREFNAMADALNSLERMRADFVSSVSHDMRTPMTTVTGFIDCILNDVIPEDQQTKYLNLIKNEIMRLSRLVSRLLDISRIEAGDRTFENVKFDICDMAKTVLFSFEKQIDEKNLDVEYASDEDRMFVFADRDAVYQVLYNLCDNAVKFSREGGRLEISLTRNGGDVEYSVFNEGQGIPEEKLPFIFDRFFKGDDTRGLDKSGYGLGLYICKSIADAQGASLSCESKEGEWCRFRFSLPAYEQTRSK